MLTTPDNLLFLHTLRDAVTNLQVTVLLSMHGQLPEGQPVSARTARAKPQVMWESEPHILFPVLPEWC